MTDEHPTKRCRKCDTMKPLDEFGRWRGADDGVARYCRSCARAASAAWRAARPASGGGASSTLKALARKAVVAERKVAEARAAKRRVAAEHKALATEVLAPALAALRAAVSALETLMQLPVASKPAKARTGNGATHRAAAPSKTPPPIRTIRAIITDDGVNSAEAKRIQESEILARAEWKAPSTVNNFRSAE